MTPLAEIKHIEFSTDLELTFGSFEAYLKHLGYNVLHLVRDKNMDWSDDNGWIVAIAEKDGKYHYIVEQIDYNISLKYIDKLNSVEFDDIEDLMKYHDTVVRSYEDIVNENKFSCDVYIDDVPSLVEIFPELQDGSENLLEALVVLSKTIHYGFATADVAMLKTIAEREHIPNYVYRGEDITDATYDDDGWIVV